LEAVQTFPIRTGRWSRLFLAPLSLRRGTVRVDQGVVRVRLGLAGRADIPVERIDRVGTMEWPKWGGFGARIAQGLVAFVAHSGTLVVIELSEPLRVRAPLGWSASSVAVGVEDPEGLIAAISQARRPPAGSPEPAGEA
jgi:hypothetical protein